MIDSETEAEAVIAALYENKFSAFTRDFRGNSAGPKIGDWTMRCDTLEQFKEIVWNKVKPYIKREILLQATDQNTESFEYNTEEPTIDDIGR